MSINDFFDDDQTPEVVTQADATQIEDGSDFFDDPIDNKPEDTMTYPDVKEQSEQVISGVAALESIREDLTGLVRQTQTAAPQTEFIVDVDLDDDSKTLLDDDIANIIAADPQVMESLESIHLCGERSAKTLISILDHKIAHIKSKQ